MERQQQLHRHISALSDEPELPFQISLNNRLVASLFVIALIFFGYYFFGPGITGLVVSDDTDANKHWQQNYTFEDAEAGYWNVSTFAGANYFFTQSLYNNRTFNISLFPDKHWNVSFSTSGQPIGNWNVSNNASAQFFFIQRTYSTRGFRLNDSGAGDSEAPQWSANQTNATGNDTRTGYSVQFKITFTDANPDTYIFSWDNGTGIFTNTSAASFSSGTPITIVRTINATRGMAVKWRWFARDTLNEVYNETPTWNFSVNNTAPAAVNLSTPFNANTTTNRTVTFAWNASNDADSDSVTYSLLVYCHGGCSADNREYTTAATSYTVPELLYLYDDNYFYNWTVRSFDGVNYSASAAERNISINSEVGIILLNDTVNFTTIGLGQSDNTTDDNPLPIVIVNTGNVNETVNISADSIWANSPSPTGNYQFRSGNYSSKPYSFNWTTSANLFTSMPLAGGASGSLVAIDAFDYHPVSDTARIEINLTAPIDEPPGNKTSTITLEARRR